MFHILYRGILIGILVSAPMGPIGLLCIQRTLYKGRWHGFFSGTGAACSDLLYALITALGIGIVIDFIENNQTVLQIVGSILLLGFGFYTLRSHPSSLKKTTKNPAGSRNSTYSTDTLTAFLLTLSNPLIIFLYIALFARFNFISQDETLYSMVLGLTGIFAGAIGWWFVLTTFTARCRNIFKDKGLTIMNHIVGIVIILLSIVGLIVSLWEFLY